MISLVDINEDGRNLVVSLYAGATEGTSMVSAFVFFKIEIKRHWLSHQFSIHYIFFYSEISQVNLLVVALHQFQVAKNHKLVGCLSLIHLLFRCIVL